MRDLSMGHVENSGLLMPPLVHFVIVKNKRNKRKGEYIMFRVAQRTDNGTKYLLDRHDKVAYFFSQKGAEEMAAVASEGIPEIITNMRVEQVTTLEDTTKSDYFD
jgi:hypothetical protein